MSVRLAICQPGLPAYRVPLFERLARLPGVQLSLFSGGLGDAHGESVEIPGAQVVDAPGKRMFGGSMFMQPYWPGIINPERFDLVVLPWNIRYANLLPTVRSARRQGVPVVLWGHGYSKHRRPLTDAMRNYVGRQADGVLVYTHSVARQLIERGGFEASKVFVAQNAIAQGPIQRAREHWLGRPGLLAAFQAEHRLDPRQTIIFVSRLLRENRMDLLLRGLKVLHRTHPETRLVIVGKGPDGERLERLAGRLGLEEKVLFTGAIYDEMALAPWMLSATLFAYPINIGLSLMQAFGYGLPVVTSDAASRQNPEIEAHRDGVNGLLYQHGSVEEMVRRWREFFEDERKRARMSEAALATVTETYTMDRMVEGFVDLLRLAKSQVPRVAHPSRFASARPLARNH